MKKLFVLLILYNFVDASGKGQAYEMEQGDDQSSEHLDTRPFRSVKPFSSNELDENEKAAEGQKSSIPMNGERLIDHLIEFLPRIKASMDEEDNENYIWPGGLVIKEDGTAYFRDEPVDEQRLHQLYIRLGSELVNIPRSQKIRLYKGVKSNELKKIKDAVEMIKNESKKKKDFSQLVNEVKQKIRCIEVEKRTRICTTTKELYCHNIIKAMQYIIEQAIYPLDAINQTKAINPSFFKEVIMFREEVIISDLKSSIEYIVKNAAIIINRFDYTRQDYLIHDNSLEIIINEANEAMASMKAIEKISDVFKIIRGDQIDTFDLWDSIFNIFSLETAHNPIIEDILIETNGSHEINNIIDSLEIIRE